MVIVQKPEACTGCRICELVCSFQHTHKFSRSDSAIKVNKSILGSEEGTKISINYGGDLKGTECNSCRGHQVPLCVSFCPEKVLEVI